MCVFHNLSRIICFDIYAYLSVIFDTCLIYFYFFLHMYAYLTQTFFYFTDVLDFL